MFLGANGIFQISSLETVFQYRFRHILLQASLRSIYVKNFMFLCRIILDLNLRSCHLVFIWIHEIFQVSPLKNTFLCCFFLFKCINEKHLDLFHDFSFSSVSNLTHLFPQCTLSLSPEDIREPYSFARGIERVHWKQMGYI